MKSEGIQFPVYRRYKNGRSYFKIINERMFEEIQSIGTARIARITEARQFPEINFIRDLVYNYSEMADEITEDEYESFRAS